MTMPALPCCRRAAAAAARSSAGLLRPSVACRRARVGAVALALSAHHAHPDPSKPLYPGAQEERDVSHDAFMHAMQAARPRAMRIPGMQEFAASLWVRRRIPSHAGTADPLDVIFQEFDSDGDGHLCAAEVAKALNSRGVEATPEQVQMFIEASDADHDHLVSREDFAAFVFRMASADLRSATAFAQQPQQPPPGLERRP